jgi:hypothetical protein
MHLQYRSISVPKISCHNSDEGIEIIFVSFVLENVTLGVLFYGTSGFPYQ